MKKITLFFLCFIILTALSAQDGSRLYRNDRVTSREDPMPLRPDWAPFFHGVASGDPLSDRVIIWTRVTPEEMDGSSVEVAWRVATDLALENIVREGTFSTNAGRDYTVKVDVDGLQPGATYYYGFTAFGRHSLTGKTKTTPTGDQADHLKFAVVSCNNYQGGFFNAFQRLAERTDLDAVIHLGDYIYEQGSGEYGDLVEERPIEPKTEILSLEDYRTRYSTYRLDTSFIRVHQQHPFITVWDDHESANDAYQDGAENHTPGEEGDWEQRKAIAKQVYFEWMPVRDMDQDQSVFRKISYGNLMDLIMLDTRLEGREIQILNPFDSLLQDSARTILGEEQRNWLLEQLGASTARWKVIGQQVVFAPFEVGFAAALDPSSGFTYAEAQGAALDIWNGYPAERRRIINFIRDREIDNVVILTGDFHTTFAFDVTDRPVDTSFQETPNLGLIPFFSPSDSYDPATGEGSVAVEFATPSISSANFDENFGATLTFFLQQLINRPVTIPGGPSLGNPNPHLKYPELSSHGYYILDVKPDSVQANWFFSEITQPTTQEAFGQAWYTRNGDNHLTQAAASSEPKAAQDTPAPNNPPESATTSQAEITAGRPFVLLGLYPNPFSESNTLHYSLSKAADLQIELYNAAGQRVRELFNDKLPAGLYTLQTDAAGLPEGPYFYRIRVGEQKRTVKVIVSK